ncbi:MAG: hypothetical protein ACFFEN_01235 [Candidatus Thorarchaeota archaeon]
MLFQLENLLSYFLSYLPIIIYLGFDIALFIIAIFIYKRNSYKYGLYLMISSIISIASSILFISLNYPFLVYELVSRGLSMVEISIILMILNLVSLILGTTSAVFLFLAVYKIYQTHKKDRIKD